MSEEEEEKIKAIFKNEIKKEIMSNLDSGLIFTYIQNLEKEIKELKERNKKQFLNYEKRVNELEHKQLNYISKDKIREFISKYTKETLKDFSPYIKDNAIPEKERKAGQLRILQKIEKELLEE